MSKSESYIIYAVLPALAVISFFFFPVWLVFVLVLIRLLAGGRRTKERVPINHSE